MKILAVSGRHVQEVQPLGFAFGTRETAFAFAAIDAGRVEADIVSGASNSVAIPTNPTLTPIIGGTTTVDLSVGPESGTAPRIYANSSTGLGIFSTGPLVSGSTSSLTITATSNITGTSSFAMATASTTISNPALNVVGGLANPLVTVEATTTSATASGTDNALSGTGSPSIAGHFTAGGCLDVSTLTGLTGVTGLSIGGDVTMTAGNDVTTAGIATDNLGLKSSNVATLSGFVNGTLDIGQSQASIVASPSAVPEPASMVMLGPGLAGVVGLTRRRGVIRTSIRG